MSQLACVFTPNTTDDEAGQYGDEGSTTYTGAIETAAEFSRRIYTWSPPTRLGRAEIVRIEPSYFERNVERMRYPKFRSKTLFMGPGVSEAGCKTVTGSRLKR